MNKKEIINVILLSLSLAYVVTKAVASFDSIDEVQLIAAMDNDGFTDSS